MNIEEKTDEIAKSIRKLTLAVWAVALALIASFLFSVFPWFFPDFFIDRFDAEISTENIEFSEPIVTPATPAAPLEWQTPEIDFYDLPVEEQIDRASMIAVAEYVESPDGQMKAIIQEILKKEPNTISYYEIGDEHPSSSYYPQEGYSHGDGLIIFFTGSPATMAVASSFTGNRIRSLGDMPLDLLRSKCKE